VPGKKRKESRFRAVASVFLITVEFPHERPNGYDKISGRVTHRKFDRLAPSSLAKPLKPFPDFASASIINPSKRDEAAIYVEKDVRAVLFGAIMNHKPRVGDRRLKLGFRLCCHPIGFGYVGR